MTNSYTTEKLQKKIRREPYFEEELGYWSGVFPPDTFNDLFILVDYRMEFKSGWFYEGYETAMTYNAKPESQRVPTVTTKAVKAVKDTKFTLFSQNAKWDFQIESFGSTVRRSLRGSTFNSIRTHGWAPWGGANLGSAPPTSENEFSPPFPYFPTVNNN